MGIKDPHILLNFELLTVDGIIRTQCPSTYMASSIENGLGAIRDIAIAMPSTDSHYIGRVVVKYVFFDISKI